MKIKVTKSVYEQAMILISKDLTHEILLTVRDRNNCMKIIYYYDNEIPIDFHYIKAVENYIHLVP
jgi:hypothetical protein